VETVSDLSTQAGPTDLPQDLIGRHRRLVRRTALVSALTLVSRLLGFVREMLSAWLFGDRSAVYDAFITAWRVPNLFRRFLGEGALATSFQTALTRTDGDEGLEAGRRLFHATSRWLSGILVVLCGVVMLGVSAMPDEMPLTGWHWLGQPAEPVRDLTVRVMPFVVLACLSALAGGALNVRGHFAAPAWAPAILNIVWIGTLALLGLRYGTSAGAPDPARHVEMTRVLAWGVLLAGIAQLVVQLPALARSGFLGRVGRAVVAQRATAREVVRRSVPLAIGAAVYQINVMIDGLMAEGLLPDGGPTTHYYANRVQQFPMALIAFAATAAVFPALQALGHARDLRAVRDLHDRTQRAICFVALPASIGLLVLARPVVSVCFEHGAFGAEGVRRTTAALQYLTLAIVPAGASGLAARTFYSLSDFSYPVRVSIAMLALNVALNLVFVLGAGMDVEGLALATAATSWGTLVLLLACLGRRLPARRVAFAGPLCRMLAGAALAGALATLAHALAAPALGSGAGLFLGIAAAALGYFLTSLALGVPELEQLLRGLRRSRG